MDAVYKNQLYNITKFLAQDNDFPAFWLFPRLVIFNSYSSKMRRIWADIYNQLTKP